MDRPKQDSLRPTGPLHRQRFDLRRSHKNHQNHLVQQLGMRVWHKAWQPLSPVVQRIPRASIWPLPGSSKAASAEAVDIVGLAPSPCFRLVSKAQPQEARSTRRCLTYLCVQSRVCLTWNPIPLSCVLWVRPSAFCRVEHRRIMLECDAGLPSSEDEGPFFHH